jgi:hypothetical protein
VVERAPAAVKDVFVPVGRVCSHCGAGVVTAARVCPRCGTPYVARREKSLATRHRRLIFAAAAVAVIGLVALGVALLSPGIDSAKRAHAAAAQRAAAAAQATLIAQERAQQALRLARARVRDPGPGASSAARRGTREAMVRELQDAITLDTRARVRAGVLTGPVLFTTCSRYPGDGAAAQATLAVGVGAYSCLAVNRPVRSTAGTVGELGDPIWARIDFRGGRFAWCKINPRPGEQAVGGGAPLVPLAPACDLSRPAPGGF